MGKQQLEFYNNNAIVKIINYYSDSKGITKKHVSYYDLINKVVIPNNSLLLNSLVQNNLKIECVGVNTECALCPDDALVANNDWCLVSNAGWVLIQN